MDKIPQDPQRIATSVATPTRKRVYAFGLTLICSVRSVSRDILVDRTICIRFPVV